MSAAPDPLGTMQQELCDLLSANPAFASVPVISEDTGDVENIYNRAMGTEQVTGGKIGACVTVVTLDADTNFDELPGPYLDDVKVLAFIEENVQTNRDPDIGTLQKARALAILVASIWQKSYPVSCSGPVTLAKPTIQRLIPFDQLREDGKVAYRVNATAKLQLNVDMTKCALPTISENSGVVTLACSTPGAAIFYTLDGSNPSPRNGTFYTAPFTPGANLQLTVRAWLAGFLASDPALSST
jgi:hypothetical protein